MVSKTIFEVSFRLSVVMHAQNPSTQEAEAGGLLQVQDSLGYKVSSRLA